MTRLEVLKEIGLVDGYSINEAADTLEEVFGCPPGVGCPTDDIPCQECWRKWLNEETSLEVKPQCWRETSMTYFIATIKAHGFKLYDFAEEIGLTGAALSNRLHGRTDWTLSEAQRVCKVLGMTLDTFAGYFPLEG